MDLPSPTWTSSWREDGPVSVWRLRLNALDGDPEEVLRPLTVPSEHERARRYQFVADRHRHLGGRALVRLVLSRRYDCAPNELSLEEGPHGKPTLQAPPGDRPPLHFNVGHTEDVVVAAFSREQPVGVDVEPQNRTVEAPSLAERVFTKSERKWWQSHPASRRQVAFLHLWTCKEAFLKATGEGLHRAPKTIECTFDGPMVDALREARNHQDASPSASADQWAVRPFSAADGVVGALVRKGEFPTSLPWMDATALINQASST